MVSYDDWRCADQLSERDRTIAVGDEQKRCGGLEEDTSGLGHPARGDLPTLVTGGQTLFIPIFVRA